MDNTIEEFDGVFRFTNWTDKERAYLWNNKEYTFPAQSTVPLIILNEPLENIQEIRKRFAFRLAEEVFYESKEYQRLSKMGNGLPPTFDPKILESDIEKCLSPLPSAKAKVKEGKKDSDSQYKATKALKGNEDPNYIFREENQNPQELGEMANA